MSFATLIEPASNRGIGLGFTDRHGGASLPPYDSFNFSVAVGDDPATVQDNWVSLTHQIGCRQIATCHQVHGAAVVEVGDGYPWRVDLDASLPTAPTPTADALVSRRVGAGLAIATADCLPVLFADAQAGLIGAAHAGRVGLFAGVLEATVAALRRLGAENLEAWIGPHVGPCCYEVPLAMAQAAQERLPPSWGWSSAGTPAIDLGAGAAAILGAQAVTVNRLDPCTGCQPGFFSHRRDHGSTGRQLGVIWLGERP